MTPRRSGRPSSRTRREQKARRLDLAVTASQISNAAQGEIEDQLVQEGRLERAEVQVRRDPAGDPVLGTGSADPTAALSAGRTAPC